MFCFYLSKLVQHDPVAASPKIKYFHCTYLTGNIASGITMLAKAAEK